MVSSANVHILLDASLIGIFAPCLPHLTQYLVCRPKTSDMEISDIELSVEEVSNCLSSLNTSKATGPDGIPARILKECGKEIAPSLCALFNHSLRTGRFPAEWKNSDVDHTCAQERSKRTW